MGNLSDLGEKYNQRSSIKSLNFSTIHLSSSSCQQRFSISQADWVHKDANAMVHWYKTTRNSEFRPFKNGSLYWVFKTGFLHWLSSTKPSLGLWFECSRSWARRAKESSKCKLKSRPSCFKPPSFSCLISFLWGSNIKVFCAPTIGSFLISHLFKITKMRSNIKPNSFQKK